MRPEHIHPALWRATQLAQGSARCVATGHDALSGQLPGGGWPQGALIELLQPHPGIGEVRLLQPALARLDAARAIALVQPPHEPHIACWSQWRLDPAQLLWVDPATPEDALWAAEQILRHGTCGALLCWLLEDADHVERRADNSRGPGGPTGPCGTPPMAPWILSR